MSLYVRKIRNKYIRKIRNKSGNENITVLQASDTVSFCRFLIQRRHLQFFMIFVRWALGLMQPGFNWGPNVQTFGALLNCCARAGEYLYSSSTLPFERSQWELITYMTMLSGPHKGRHCSDVGWFLIDVFNHRCFQLWTSVDYYNSACFIKSQGSEVSTLKLSCKYSWHFFPKRLSIGKVMVSRVASPLGSLRMLRN